MIQETREWWQALGNAQRFFIVCLLISPLLLLLWRDGRNLTLLLAGLPGLWFGFRVGFRQFIDKAGHRTLWLVWAYLAVGFLAWALAGFDPEGWDRYDRHLRILFFLPWLILLLWTRPPVRLVWLSLGVAGMGIGLAAGWEVWQSGDGLAHRVEGDAHAMSYGIISALITTALAGAAWQYRRQPLFALLLAVAAALALMGIALTGVRAAILGLAGGILALVILFAWFGDRRGALLFLGVPMLGLAAVMLTAQQGITARFIHGMDDLIQSQQTESRMPARDLVQAGCQDNPQLLSAWLDSSAVDLIGDIDVALIEGAPEARCGAGTRIRLMAGQERGSARFQRSQHDPEATPPIRLHARGDGVELQTEGGEWRRLSAELEFIEWQGRDQIRWRLQPGGWVEWLPEATLPGEYRYPHVRGSMAQRMEMWQIAWQAFQDKPLIGHGTGRFHRITEPLIDEGLAPEIIRDYSHAHSEYLDALATRGLLGFATLALWLLGMLYIALRPGPEQRKNANHPGIPLAGVWACFMLALLTEASLSMNLTAVTVALFMALTLYLGNHGLQPPDWSRNRLRFW